jgi:hypothetical protein
MRVTIAELARITQRSEHTWRNWLSEADCRLTVVYGGRKGGTPAKPGRVRYLDLDECRALHRERGGQVWREDMLPPASLDAIAAELDAMRAELRELRLRRPASYEPAQEVNGFHQEPEEELEVTQGDITGHRRALPRNLIPLNTFARAHGARETQSSTFRHVVRSGSLTTVDGAFIDKRGMRVNHALDASGRQRFYELYHDRDWWRPCPACPHDEERERETGLRTLEEMMRRADERERIAPLAQPQSG